MCGLQHLSHLEQEAADYRQQASVQSVPESVTQELCYHHQDLHDNHLGQEVLMFSSSAPADTMSLLPPVRTSIPSTLQKQVRRKILNRLMSCLNIDAPQRRAVSQ